MDLISRDKAQDAVFSKEDIMSYMDGVEDGDINRTIRSAIRLIERVPSAFEGMTNRDVLKALFPIDENKGARFIKVYLDHVAIESFELLTTQKWLDSPYKGVSDEF